MNIVFLSEDYPDEKRINYPFVKLLVDALANQGHNIQVVAPFNVTHNKRFCRKKQQYEVNGNKVIIYRPNYLSFSNISLFGINISSYSFRRAINRGLSNIVSSPDVMYGHFWHTAFSGYHYALKRNIPIFVATGESTISFRADTKEKKAFCDYVKGVVCVSSKNRDDSIQLGLTNMRKCILIPNAIDNSLFRKKDKALCRKQLNLPADAFIVAFVGWFNERKGVLRVSEALSKIKGERVFSLFIGHGALAPQCPGILFKGPLPHEEIPVYLNAADAFCLPTLNEGCCNAVIEAMACGLPVISSNLLFNKDVCDESNSILVDPNDIEAIIESISRLRDEKRIRIKLSDGALKTAEGLTISKRASAIIDFIEEKIN